MPKPKRSQNPETDITHTIRDLLKLAGIPHSKILQGLGAEKGIADIIGCLPDQGGRMLAIEVKTPKGKVSEHQKEWLARMKKGGALCLVARGPEDVARALKLAIENKLKM